MTKLDGGRRFVWVSSPTCNHCGVKFTCRIDAKEAFGYVAIDAIDPTTLTKASAGGASDER